MGSALLNTAVEPELATRGTNSAAAAAGSDAAGARRTRSASVPASAEALRLEVVERLAAHRRRRPGAPIAAVNPASEAARSAAATRSAQIAAVVAERYARTPSYRAFLAAEAERAIQQARAAAEVAALNARAVVAAQQRLLEALAQVAADEIDGNEEAPARQAQAGGYDAIGEALQAASSFRGVRPAELNLWPELDVETDAETEEERPPAPQSRGARARRSASEARTPNPAARREPMAANRSEFTVRLYEYAASAADADLGASRHTSGGGRMRMPGERGDDDRSDYERNNDTRSDDTRGNDGHNDAEARALDEEIAFRQAPVFEEPAGPPVPLPANLIEFPRQLVAPRKARPRYAEGPLREEGEAAPGDGQLRIFEVDAADISTQPDVAEAQTAQWTSIWLDSPLIPHVPDIPDIPEGTAPGQVDRRREHELDALAGETLFEPAGRTVGSLWAASLGRRMMACATNAGIVLTGLAAFAATFVVTSDRSLQAGLPPGQSLRELAVSIPAQMGLQPATIALVGAIVGVLLYLLYQALFFWFNEATPGMLSARIGLCTFDDENPTRRAIRWRMVAVMISALPLGLGFLWSMVDEDRLTWHDRISRMYLRSY